MAYWLSEVQQFLAAQGSLSLVSGTNLWTTKMLDTPAAAVCLYDTGGMQPQFFLDGTYMERPTMQVITRAVAVDDAWTKARLIFDILARRGGGALISGGKKFISFTPIQSPEFLKRDDKDQAYVTCNYEVLKEV